MTIKDMTNLYVAYNETEDITIYVIAYDSTEAESKANGYGEDAGLNGTFEILDVNIDPEMKVDADYIIN